MAWQAASSSIAITEKHIMPPLLVTATLIIVNVINLNTLLTYTMCGTPPGLHEVNITYLTLFDVFNDIESFPSRKASHADMVLLSSTGGDGVNRGRVC